MAISYSYDSPPSGMTFANGWRSTQWLTPDEGKCCENGLSENLRVGFCVLSLCVCYILCVSLSRFPMCPCLV